MESYFIASFFIMTRKIITFFALVLLFTEVNGQEIKIDLKIPTRPVITVESADLKFNGEISFEEGKKNLAVYLVNDKKAANIPLLGTYSQNRSMLKFVPQYDLGKGLEFEVQFYASKDTIRKRFTIVTEKNNSTPLSEVTGFFPITDKIPANILLFYVQFSQLMTDEILAWKEVKILDDQGKERTMPWRNKSYWVNNTILVLMIHPAYVKRGIESFKENGELFTIGKQFTIVVTTGIKDALGRSIKKEFSKKFTIIEEDRKIPEIQYQNFTIPKVNSKQALTLKFSEGMDYVSILTSVKLYNKETGTALPGKMNYTANDSTWNFVPENKWQNTTYEVRFEKTVADFANNHLHRLFEIKDLSELNDDGMPKKWEFTPKSR